MENRPRTTTYEDDWETNAPEYRSRWEQTNPEDPSQWSVHEPWYRYGHEMARDTRFQGRQWSEVEPDLREGFPEWAQERGYPYQDEDGWWWEKFKADVRNAWDSITGKR